MADTGKKISDADKALMRRMKPSGLGKSPILSDSDMESLMKNKPVPKGIGKAELNEMMGVINQRSRNPYSDADRELLRKQPTRKPKKMKKGGEVCRGGRSAERGTQFRGVR
jgi:hypothetical protein